MSQYKISAWGDGKEIAPFDVSSTILNYLINEHSLNETFQIIPNSNIFDSHSGRLPVLTGPESPQLEGFVEIWNFIVSNSHIGNEKAENDNFTLEILRRAYMDEITRNMNIITLYNYFVVKQNYEGFTRGSFKGYLPWPTQYKPPLDFRHYAKEMCLNEGIIDNDLMNSDYTFLESDLEDELQQLRKEEKNLRETPVINDMQKLQIDKQLDIIIQKKYIIANMQCIKKLKEVIQKHQEMKSILDDKMFDTILLIYLKCNTERKLPENFISSWIKREYPELNKEISELNISGSMAETNKISLTTALGSYVSQVI